MPTLAAPPAAAEHHASSALWAAEAAQTARKAKPGGTRAIARAIARYQAGAALRGQTAVGQILADQDIASTVEAALNPLAFTTEVDRLLGMIDATAAAEFDRLVESLVQDAGRAAESVAVAVRPDIRFVRYLTLPSCSRCAVLAGRVYRYSQGFLRHPNCDCVMLPTTVAAPGLVQDPVELAKAGQIRGLSHADLLAVEDGADFGQVVNVRLRKAGLRQAGKVLARRGKPTPEGIYAMAGEDRVEAVRLLKLHGYLL
jgi:hypothetical protein